MKNLNKKISLKEFKGIQMSVNTLSKIKGGCGCEPGVTSTIGSDTCSYSGDKDSGCYDWD